MPSDSPILPASQSIVPFLSYEFGVPLELERTEGVYNWCPSCIGTGLSASHRLRLGFRFSLDQLFGISEVSPFSVRGSLSFFASNGTFRSDPYTRSIDTGRGLTELNIEEHFTVSALSAGLGTGLLGEVRIGAKTFFSTGPWLDYRPFSRYIQRSEILSPESASYDSDGTKNRIVAEGATISNGDFSAGWTASLGQELRLSPSFILLVEPGLRTDFAALADGILLRSFSPTFSLGVISTSEPPPQVTIEPTPVPAPPSPPRLEVSIDLYAVAPDGTRMESGTVRMRRELHRLHSLVEEDAEVEQIVERYEASPIGIDPNIRADSGIAWWGISIRRGEKEIGRLTSEHPEKHLDLTVSYDHPEEKLEPLTAEMILQDSVGNITAARDFLYYHLDTISLARDGDEFDLIEDRWEIPVEFFTDHTRLAPILDEMRTLRDQSPDLHIEVLCPVNDSSTPDASCAEQTRILEKWLGVSVREYVDDTVREGWVVVVGYSGWGE